VQIWTKYCTKAFGSRALPRPEGAYSTAPDLLVGLSGKRGQGKVRAGKGEGKKGRGKGRRKGGERTISAPFRFPGLLATSTGCTG